MIGPLTGGVPWPRKFIDRQHSKGVVSPYPMALPANAFLSIDTTVQCSDYCWIKIHLRGIAWLGQA